MPLALADPPEDLAAAVRDPVALLALGEAGREAVARLCDRAADEDFADRFALVGALPFAPAALRAFMGWERHWIQAARGLVRHNLRPAAAAIGAFERVTRRPFPAFRPGRLFYEQPAFYMGNHLTFAPDGATLPWPRYCEELDFELELGAVLCRPVRDATPAQAEAAIGGFVVVDDLSARDTQWREYRHGLFGPLGKTKTFANAMSAELVSADVVLPRAERLHGSVRVNDETWSRTSTAGMQHTWGETVAFASAGEQLFPGELLSSGTLPDGCGLELDRWLKPGDDLELEIEGVATLRNRIGARVSAGAA